MLDFSHRIQIDSRESLTTRSDGGEFCDLKADPGEMRNLYDDPGSAGFRAELEARLSSRPEDARPPQEQVDMA